MKSWAVSVLLVSLVVSAASWWGEPALRRAVSLVVRANDRTSLDYFLETKSFSEIEGTKALLEALAAQTISDIRTRLAPKGKGSLQDRAAAAEVGLREVERRIEEFKGTEQELLLVKEQLILLFQAGRHDRWLDVYLASLYQHPTHEVVGQFAQRALMIGQETGREEAVVAGFWHVADIPLEFNNKSIVQAALLQRPLASHSSPGHENKLL